MRTTDVRDRMLAENETIGWHPEHIKHGRFGKWLEGNVDWALSRERYWGTPLPIWECRVRRTARSASAPGRSPTFASAAGRCPTTCTAPTSTRSSLRCEACGGEMRRVRGPIDAWYDSGSMPFAQFHYPFEGEESFNDRFPAEFISEAIDQTRGWFYSLLAISVLIFDRTSYRELRRPGPDPGPRGPEDVQEPGQHRRPVGGDRPPRRRRLPLVLPRRPAALGRLPLLHRHGRRGRAPVHAHALEHVLVLGSVRERRGARAQPSRGRPRVSRAPTISTGGRCPGCRERSPP